MTPEVPWLVTERHGTIGRDGRQFRGVCHDLTLRLLLSIAKVANQRHARHERLSDESAWWVMSHSLRWLDQPWGTGAGWILRAGRFR